MHAHLSRFGVLLCLLVALNLSPAARATDYNGDGMCDVWQQLFSAFDLAPGDDEDNDGCSNLVESIAGTDPRDPSDCHHISDLTAASSDLVFTFQAEKGKKYRVVRADSPKAVTWDVVPGSEKISNEDHSDDSITITKDAGDRKFYKLEVLDADSDSDGVSDWAENKTGTDPATAASSSNASGGAASDGAVLESIFSLTAAPLAGSEVSLEKENTTAKIVLQRSVGTMPLTLPYSVTGSEDATKGSASPVDYLLRRSTDNSQISGGSLTIPAGVSSMNVVVDAVLDTAPEVPELVDFHLHRPVTGSAAPPISAAVTLADADPAVDTNRTLFVAYLGREAGVSTTASGIGTALVEGDNDGAVINLSFSNLSSPQNTAYLRVGSDLDILSVGLGQVTGKSWPIRAAQTKVTDQAMLTALHAGELYIAVTTADYPGGEIIGYFNKATGSTNFIYDPLVHDAPALGSPSWPAPVGDEVERDIYRFLEQSTYGATEALYTEVRGYVDAALGSGGTVLDGYEAWIDQQMAEPWPSLQTLVMAADNEEFVLRGSKPINSGNDPNFSGASYSVSYDIFGNPNVSTTANSTYNNNHPFHNNRRREMWTLATQSKAQVRQRMTQALTEILVISELDGTVKSKHYGAASYWDMIAAGAFGSFREMLEGVTYHPMMGIYLSHLRNRSQYVSGGVTISPDENYAREIMQLFSIGLIMRHPDGSLILDGGGLPIPTYDNTDITELARVMTGFCHGARHQTYAVQRFNGISFYNTSPRVGPNIEIQGGSNVSGVSFTNFGEGGGDSWWQAPWIYPMKVLGRVGTTVYHDFSAKTLLHTYNGGTVIPAQTLPSGDTQTVRAQTHAMAAADLELAHNLLAGDSAAGTYNGHTNTPVNISRWLIQRFTSSNPSAGYLYRVSETFRQSNGNLGEVLKAILLDYEARSLVLADSAVGHGRMKEPLVHFMGLLRALNAYSNIPLTTLKDAPTPFSTGESPLTTPYPQSEIDKFQSLSPATWTEPTRFRFGDYTSVLGQSTLAAPSVFNWFLPDYTVPGTLAEAGLVSPEFQIATETNVVNRVNRLYSFALAALAGTTTYPGVDVDAPISITTSAAPEVKVSTALPGAATASTFLPEQTFVFNTSNWSTPRTVTVAAADDRRVEGNHTTQIRHSSTSSDIAYSNRTFDELTVNITDNEANGNARVILTESGGETLVVEGGGAGPASDTYDLVLGSAPSADVTIQITPAITYFGVNTTDVTVSPTSVTFTPGNWATPQTVTVTAVNDTHSEGPEIGLVSHVIQSADPVYAAVSAPSLNAIVGDNDNNGTYTVSVLQSANQTLVLEGGATDSYRVALRRQPTANVTMAINAGSQLTTAPTSLTFTTADWYVPKTVTVTAVDDAAVEGRHTQQISNAFSGGGYSVSNNFNATIEDNDGGSLIIAETSGSTDVTENFAGVPSGSNPILPSAALDSYTIRLGTAPTSDVTVTVAPERNPSKTSLWSKQAGYFLGDMNNNNSDQQKERIVLNYDFLINLYATTFAAMPGISGTPTNAQKQAAHFAATTAVVDKLDLLLAGGRLKAVGGSLALVDLNNTAIINPRKSIIAAVYSGYSTTRGNKVTDEPAFTNEIKARVRIAGYLVAISPASFISK